jgi:hypothetical protein
MANCQHSFARVHQQDFCSVANFCNSPYCHLCEVEAYNPIKNDGANAVFDVHLDA